MFPQVISPFDVPDHRLALAGYLADYELEYEQDEDHIVVRQNGTPVLVATFDKQNRLTQLEIELTPTPERSWDEAQLRRMLRG